MLEILFICHDYLRRCGNREEWEEMDPFESPEDYDDCGGDCGSCGVEGCGVLEESEINFIMNEIKEDQQ